MSSSSPPKEDYGSIDPEANNNKNNDNKNDLDGEQPTITGNTNDGFFFFVPQRHQTPKERREKLLLLAFPLVIAVLLMWAFAGLARKAVASYVPPPEPSTPDFNNDNTPTYFPATAPIPPPPLGPQACGSHPACSDLLGDCCPTPEGDMLGCCRNTETDGEDQASTDTDDGSSSSSSSLSLCANNEACVELQLIGQCCPTAAGLMLGCCDSSMSASSNVEDDSNQEDDKEEEQDNGDKKEVGTSNSSGIATATDDASDDSLSPAADCDANPTCSKLGLIGVCCPTAEGTMLGCCS